jgi:hypothetical protein
MFLHIYAKIWRQPLSADSRTSRLAASLSAVAGLMKIRGLYEKNGAKIFHDNVSDNIADLGKLIGADYSNENLEREDSW